MSEVRPELNLSISFEQFRAFYWLKEELTQFCRAHDLSTSGSKIELTERIAYFLEHGLAPQEIAKPKLKSRKTRGELSLDALIRDDYRSDEEHRAFFKVVIGENFKFTTSFMNFCKENKGKKTYADAVDCWLAEQEFKRDPNYQTQIAPQFEYNRFIRAYFEHNPDGKREEAIQLWKETKAKAGDNVYRPAEQKKLNED